ncbi:hypothetical protein FA95DRAFT_1607659 [Auriscalpium vulgare]|uniref:Uncharacterized protein n=1 Tax=Auriscalpium vulgare TaxID=40419 RepID=A0ACB8RMY0_9AGAM|nr:hypothetical protein FA95DRAFT_1607659 [Auriscalpium vulgare]
MNGAASTTPSTTAFILASLLTLSLAYGAPHLSSVFTSALSTLRSVNVAETVQSAIASLLPSAPTFLLTMWAFRRSTAVCAKTRTPVWAHIWAMAGLGVGVVVERLEYPEHGFYARVTRVLESPLYAPMRSGVIAASLVDQGRLLLQDAYDAMRPQRVVAVNCHVDINVNVMAHPQEDPPPPYAGPV